MLFALFCWGLFGGAREVSLFLFFFVRIVNIFFKGLSIMGLFLSVIA